MLSSIMRIIYIEFVKDLEINISLGLIRRGGTIEDELAKT